MTDFLLDTNHASPLATLGHPLRERIAQEVLRGSRFAIAAPCLAELYLGLGLLPRAEASRRNWDRVMRGLAVYPVDRTDAERAASLQIELRKQGWQLGTVDALTAAVALRYQLTLLTRDQDFCRVTGLEVIDWLAP